MGKRRKRETDAKVGVDGSASSSTSSSESVNISKEIDPLVTKSTPNDGATVISSVTTSTPLVSTENAPEADGSKQKVTISEPVATKSSQDTSSIVVSQQTQNDPIPIGAGNVIKQTIAPTEAPVVSLESSSTAAPTVKVVIKTKSNPTTRGPSAKKAIKKTVIRKFSKKVTTNSAAAPLGGSTKMTSKTPIETTPVGQVKIAISGQATNATAAAAPHVAGLVKKVTIINTKSKGTTKLAPKLTSVKSKGIAKSSSGAVSALKALIPSAKSHVAGPPKNSTVSGGRASILQQITSSVESLMNGQSRAVLALWVINPTEHKTKPKIVQKMIHKSGSTLPPKKPVVAEPTPITVAPPPETSVVPKGASRASQIDGVVKPEVKLEGVKSEPANSSADSVKGDQNTLNLGRPRRKGLTIVSKTVKTHEITIS